MLYVQDMQEVKALSVCSSQTGPSNSSEASKGEACGAEIWLPGVGDSRFILKADSMFLGCCGAFQYGQAPGGTLNYDQVIQSRK